MLRYVLKRLAVLPVLLLGVTLVLFLVTHSIPGDPARIAAGPHAGPEQIEAVRTEYGLNKPLLTQYVIYVSKLIQGDLGRSILTRRPVTDDLKDYFPATLELAAAASLLTLVVGVPLGVLSAIRQNSMTDHVSRIVALVGVSTPVFWMGLLLQLVFYRALDLLPANGRLSPVFSAPAGPTGLYLLDSLLHFDVAVFANALAHLALPALALAFSSIAVTSRMTRSSLLEVLSQDYVRTARAKGLKPSAVYLKHALRNALIPVLTILALQFGATLGGALLIEVVFDWPGMGLYAVNAITSLDYPAVIGTALVSTLVFAAVNLVVDLTYVLIDPRIAFE